MTGDYMLRTKAELVAESKKRKLSIKASMLKAEIAEELVKDDRRKKRAIARKKERKGKTCDEKEVHYFKTCSKKSLHTQKTFRHYKKQAQLGYQDRRRKVLCSKRGG